MERYRAEYWPKSRRLRRYRIHMAPVERGYGEIDPKEHVLRIDISAHATDDQVCATVLHEMIHAAVGIGHGVLLGGNGTLAEAARANRGWIPRDGRAEWHLCVIPKRFRRCRALFRPVYLRQQREFRDLKGDILTPHAMATEIEDAAAEQDLKWREVWGRMVWRYGFVDMDGRLLPSAECYRAACRRGYRRGRRFLLGTQRAAAR